MFGEIQLTNTEVDNYRLCSTEQQLRNIEIQNTIDKVVTLLCRHCQKLMVRWSIHSFSKFLLRIDMKEISF